MILGLETSALPRLLYVGDVPVESSYHGSALLYRLLQDYPPDRLMVVESERRQSLPERRLPGVAHRRLSIRAQRWQDTRLHRWAGSWMTLSASSGALRLRDLLDGYEPEAVLTVAHGYSWLAAARFAEDAKVPLHLILHDHWPATVSTLGLLKRRLDRNFARIYRRAVSRLCVSPFMEDEYRRNYSVAGQVLYPSRAKDCSLLNREPRTYGKESGPLVGAFAGNIYDAGYSQPIISLAKCLEARGGRMLLFGPHSPGALQSLGLNRRNILPQGLISSKELIARLSDEADFVFVPMAFALGESRQNMRLNFPSKLTDYTATGLPLLICGPEYCSAVRWAQHHAPLAEVVTSQAAGDLDAAVRRLEQTHHRRQLGLAAMNLGNRLFSHRASVETFCGALLSGHTDVEPEAATHGAVLP